jgi:hypothetical protein
MPFVASACFTDNVELFHLGLAKPIEQIAKASWRVLERPVIAAGGNVQGVLGDVDADVGDGELGLIVFGGHGSL